MHRIKIKSPANFFYGLNKTFLWVDLSFFNSSYWWYYNDKEGLPDIGGTTIQDVVGHLDLNVTEVCSQGPNWQYPSIGLDNGLVPNRQQGIICTNADRIRWRIYAALWGTEYLISTYQCNTHLRN